uniref:CCHC-type domain-containing protein n=1 Tax=Latimeria chalumnae TaxID=7897 RepID=H3A625_LATCH
QPPALKDDIKAYLLAFERCAKQEDWPREQWAGIVAPFLMGDAQKAYFDLEPEAAADYSTLKAEILARAGVTPTVWAQRFHMWSYQEGKAPRSQMFDLIHLARRWLQPKSSSAARIMELVIMDRYLCALPLEVQKWAGQRDPSNAQELIALVERQILAEELVKTTTSTAQRSPGHPPSPKQGLKARTVGHELGGKQKGSKNTVNEKGVGKMICCYRCNEPGHIAIQCPMNEEPMQCDLGELIINQSDVFGLTDSGSAVTLISTSLIKPSLVNQAQKRSITCVHRDVNYYPTSMVKFKTQGGNLLEVGVISKLPHATIIGQD